MKSRHALISGSSIAGPALAYWLSRYGATVTVVERAAALRPGGQSVDFRGATHLHVLERMGLLEAVRRQHTGMGETVFIRADGTPKVRLPSIFLSGDVEIERGDLSRILYEATCDRVEYLFGDSIVARDETPDAVEVRFASGATRRFDWVIGADGLHSNVRALSLGAEAQFLRFHGYYVAAFDAPNLLGLDHTSVIYSVAKRSVSVSSGRDRQRARVMFVFAEGERDLHRQDLSLQKRGLTQRFKQMGWQVPALLDALQAAPELYFDEISRVDVPRYAAGRVALLGDSAWGGTLGGQGTGLAIVGAYVLAGELDACGGDQRRAFAQYESRMRAYATACQQGAKRVGPFFAPKTRAGVWLRDRMYGALSAPPLERVLEKLVTSSASRLELPEYRAA